MKILEIILIVTNILLIFLIFLHKGRGGGLSNLFGGNLLDSAFGSAGLAESNLNRSTILLSVLWFGLIIFIGILN